MFGGQQPILVLSEYKISTSQSPIAIELSAGRSKHKERIGPQSAVGEHPSRKGMTHMSGTWVFGFSCSSGHLLT